MKKSLQSAAITDVRHWDSVWNSTRRVPAASSLNYYDSRLAELFSSVSKPGDRVLEVGCGGSRWLAYFCEERRCESWGVDYSRAGLRLTAALSRDPILVEGDFFDQALLPSEHFDLVYSLGFIEHFTELSSPLRRAYTLMRPGGRIVTLVPNFVGLYGWMQRAVSPDIFRKHVVVTPGMLDEAHVRAGFVPEFPATYFGCFGPGVVNFDAWQNLAMLVIKPVQHCTCWLLRLLHLEFQSSALSPYVVGVYRRSVQDKICAELPEG